MDRYLIYGEKGAGSVPVEATLLLLGEPYQLVERTTQENQAGIGADALARVNPMGQVPALVLPTGELMTESAAILIYLADSHPTSSLSPALDDPRRPAFLRWMAYVSAQIYAMYWVRDVPERLAADEAHKAVILQRTAERIAHCWRTMGAQLDPRRYILGDDLTVLDLYVTVASRWTPGRKRFDQEAPNLADVVRRVDQDTRLVDFWAERFPLVQV